MYEEKLEALIKAAQAVCQEGSGSLITRDNLISKLRVAGSDFEKERKRNTHVHKKSKKNYRQLFKAKMEIDLSEVIVYRGEDGQVWVRPSRDFDEKFERVAPFPLIAVKKVVSTEAVAFKWSGMLEDVMKVREWLGPDYAVSSYDTSFSVNIPGQPSAKYLSVSGGTAKDSINARLEPGDWIIKNDDSSFFFIQDTKFGDLGYTARKQS